MLVISLNSNSEITKRDLTHIHSCSHLWTHINPLKGCYAFLIQTKCYFSDSFFCVTILTLDRRYLQTRKNIQCSINVKPVLRTDSHLNLEPITVTYQGGGLMVHSYHLFPQLFSQLFSQLFRFKNGLSCTLWMLPIRFKNGLCTHFCDFSTNTYMDKSQQQ